MAYLTGEMSKFPGGIDNFHEVFDLSHNQLQRARKLNELRTQISPLTPSQEQEILSITAELKDNMITSNDWNIMGSAITNLQRFFNEEVYDYIQEQKADWDNHVKQFNHKGVWASGKQYVAQNLVSLPNGSLYMARKDHTSSTNNQPSQLGHTEFWALIGSKGDKGNPGLSANYKGNWVSNTAYKLGDAVTHVNSGINGGIIYIARRDNTGKSPQSSPDDWQLYTQIWTHRNAPLGAQAGTHFIQILE